MGKRELLLIVGFVVVGAVVYQATAPAPQPGQRGFSFGRLLEAARREVRGNQATAELTTTARHKVGPELTEVRIAGPVSEVEVAGEDRADIESTFYVHSNSYDEAEAKEHTRQSRIVEDLTASALILRAEFPQGGRQRGTVKLRIPTRLHLRIEPGSARVAVKNIASLEITGTRGEATISQVAGRVEIAHRGGEVTIENVGSLEFNGRSGALKLSGVEGDASIRMEGGEINVAKVGGGLNLETRNTNVTLEDLAATRGPIRVNVNGGEVRMKGLRSEARIDVRNADVDVAMSAPAPVAIYNEGQRLKLAPPPGGFSVDVLVIGGEILVPPSIEQLGLRATKDTDREARMIGKVRGGGPTITVRSTRADLDLQSSSELDDKKSTDEKAKTQ